MFSAKLLSICHIFRHLILSLQFVRILAISQRGVVHAPNSGNDISGRIYSDKKSEGEKEMKRERWQGPSQN